MWVNGKLDFGMVNLLVHRAGGGGWLWYVSCWDVDGSGNEAGKADSEGEAKRLAIESALRTLQKYANGGEWRRKLDSIEIKLRKVLFREYGITPPETERERLERSLVEATTRTGGDRPMKIQIRRLTPTAILPTYATDGAAGMDLYADEGATLGSEPIRVRTGIALAIPPGYEAQVRPRSGLTLRGIVAELGTIDSDYRGEVSVVMHAMYFYDVTPGHRIAQLVIAPVVRAELVEVDSLDETARGADGFGSTGR